MPDLEYESRLSEIDRQVVEEDEADAAAGAPPAFPPANVRVMVRDVDACCTLANEIGVRVILPIADRYYGLRDFTIADPDGFGIRFASLLRQR